MSSLHLLTLNKEKVELGKFIVRSTSHTNASHFGYDGNNCLPWHPIFSNFQAGLFENKRPTTRCSGTNHFVLFHIKCDDASKNSAIIHLISFKSSICALMLFTFWTPISRGRHVSKKLDVKTFPICSSNRGASKLHWSKMPSKQKALVCPKTSTKILY